jgi:hypothetical protein
MGRINGAEDVGTKQETSQSKPLKLHNCISVTPIIKKQTLENIHKMLCESKITYGIEVWGLSKA